MRNSLGLVKRLAIQLHLMNHRACFWKPVNFSLRIPNAICYGVSVQVNLAFVQNHTDVTDMARLTVQQKGHLQIWLE